MGHGVEVRMPFLDWRLVCFAFSVPDESKVGRGYSKLLLREAMRGVLPDAVRLRHDKLGYNAPVAQWLNGPLREWLWSELNDPAFLDNHLWDGPAMLALAESKRRSRAPWTADEAHRVTLAVSAHWWLTRWARIRPAVGH
jgi:asparagine synthase (glutamine-hydrolysing)